MFMKKLSTKKRSPRAAKVKKKENELLDYKIENDKHNMVMEDSVIYSNIAKLPEELKKEVSHFVEFLLEKSKDRSQTAKKERKPQAVFGSGKGLITYMADDFDAPLEDFKECEECEFTT